MGEKYGPGWNWSSSYHLQVCLPACQVLFGGLNPIPNEQEFTAQAATTNLATLVGSLKEAKD